MIISRGPRLAQVLGRMINVKRTQLVNQQPRRLMSSAPWSYRTAGAPIPRSTLILAEVIGGVMWWWIFWHLWHDFDHIVGEFPYPDPSKWTNEELGIPSDDYQG